MKAGSSSTATGSSVSDGLRHHADLLDRTPIGQLSEDEVIDLVRSNQRTIRLLEGVGSSAAIRLTELGGLSAEDVFSTVGKNSTAEARRVQRRGDLATALPALSAGFMMGSISTANLDAVAIARHKLRHHGDWTVAFDAMDTSIARKAARMNPKRFSSWIGGLVDRLSDDGETEHADQSQKNTFKSWTSADGRFRASLDLDSLAGEQLQNAIDSEARSLAKQRASAGEEVHHGEHLNANALCSLIGSATTAKGRPSINVVCDLETLRKGESNNTIKHTGAGNNLPLSKVRQFLCDAWITHTVIGPSGRALAVGRSYRTATDAQRAALRVMYDTCALCDVRFDYCEIHHIIEWENGGLTNLDNLIPLCSVHHHKVHDTGWTISMDNDRTVTERRPNGEVVRTLPLPSRKRSHHHRKEHRDRTSSTIE